MPQLSDLPLILFGAFDRHNFGDLLLAEISASVLRHRPLVFAGLAERDLTAFGGRKVRSIAEVAREWGDQPADVVQTGGEILTCSLYEAAVMLLSQEAARQAIACHDADQAARQAWSEELLGLHQQVAYLVPRSLFRRPRNISILRDRRNRAGDRADFDEAGGLRESATRRPCLGTRSRDAGPAGTGTHSNLSGARSGCGDRETLRIANCQPPSQWRAGCGGRALSPGISRDAVQRGIWR